MPNSGYPFAAKVGQFKPPNWASSEYRNQLDKIVALGHASEVRVEASPPIAIL